MEIRSVFGNLDLSGVYGYSDPQKAVLLAGGNTIGVHFEVDREVQETLKRAVINFHHENPTVLRAAAIRVESGSQAANVKILTFEAESHMLQFDPCEIDTDLDSVGVPDCVDGRLPGLDRRTTMGKVKSTELQRHFAGLTNDPCDVNIFSHILLEFEFHTFNLLIIGHKLFHEGVFQAS